MSKAAKNPAVEVAEKKARVLIVDDHPLLREGASRWINADEGLQVCGEAVNAHQALEMIDKLKPDIALVDLSLEESNGMSLIKDIKIRFPQLPVLVLSMHDEVLYAERAIHAGARGYVMKQENPSVLIDAIHQVLNGQTALSQNLTRLILDRLGGSRPEVEASPLSKLTDRELEIFELIGEGFGTREIAQELNLSEKTIASHRENIKLKLNLKSSSELVRHAIHWAREPRAETHH